MLDTAFEKRIQGLNYTPELFYERDVPGAIGLDIKTTVNMTPFEPWKNTILYFEFETLLTNFLGATTAQQIIKLKN
jgi:hypothetical protein